MKLHSELIKIEQEAQELDKQLWFKAWSQLRNKPLEQVRWWLDGLPKSEQADMRKRLNTMRGKVKIKNKRPR